MDEISALVDKLIGKTSQMMDLHQREVQLKNELHARVNELETTINEQKNQIKQLEETIETLKINQSLEQGKARADTKMKINDLIIEIDRCIGMLNNERDLQ